MSSAYTPGEPLIPIVRVEDALGDPVVLATWHEALSSALSTDVPHDLLALWLFPTHGDEVVLLGPAALAADDLAVPTPSPYLRLAQLTVLEEIVRDAGYASAVCLPIRFGRRDVALLLVADLRPDRYTETEQALLHRATQRLAPMLGRLARRWAESGAPARQAERLGALIDALGLVNAETGSPRSFSQALSRALEPLIPHDHLELLIPTPADDRWFRLGEHAGGSLWTDPALVIDREILDVGGLFGTGERLLIADTYADRRWPRGFLTATEPAGAELRALVGVRVPGPGASLAYLLLGSIGQDFYGDDEAALLARVAGLIRPRIEEFIRAGVADRNRSPRPLMLTGPARHHPLAAIAELLATTTDPVEALRLAAEEAQLLLPFHALHYALRLNDGDRVVLLEPGERRPLPDLPLLPIAGTALAAVLHGERPHLYEVAYGESRIVVPLRVAGRVHGAVVLMSARVDAFDEASVTLAQQLADLLAPHFELLRRAALLPPPYAPGWKRSGR